MYIFNKATLPWKIKVFLELYYTMRNSYGFKINLSSTHHWKMHLGSKNLFHAILANSKRALFIFVMFQFCFLCCAKAFYKNINKPTNCLSRFYALWNVHMVLTYTVVVHFQRTWGKLQLQFMLFGKEIICTRRTFMTCFSPFFLPSYSQLYAIRLHKAGTKMFFSKLLTCNTSTKKSWTKKAALFR